MSEIKGSELDIDDLLCPAHATVCDPDKGLKPGYFIDKRGHFIKRFISNPGGNLMELKSKAIYKEALETLTWEK